MAEFKINRLRYTWLGAWVTATVYGKDSVVQYNGKTYACLTAHTASANFYTDLNFVDGLGASTPYWQLIVDGKTWKNTWATNRFYSAGNIVAFGGTLYTCVTPHTSTAFAANSANWIQYSQFTRWDAANSKTDWAINTVYGINDVVKYGGIVYVCNTNHTSSSATTTGSDPEIASGLEADQAKWTILNSGIDYKPAGWQNGTRYKLNDVVKYGANLWKSNAGHTSTTTFNPARWTMWLPGESYNPTTWSASGVYQIGDIVNYGGYQYINNTTNNTNNTPSTDATNWTLFTKNYNFRNDWLTGTAYKIGDTVRRNGRLYNATSDVNAGVDPSAGLVYKTYTLSGSSGTTLKVNSTTSLGVGMIVIGTGFSLGQSVISISDSTTVIIDKGPDSTPANGQTLSFVGVNTGWALVDTGNAYIGRWTTFPSNYTIGDLVVWQNATYMCIQTHANTSMLDFQRPDLDTTRSYWSLFINHDKNNSLTSLGDIEAFSSGQPTAIPVGTESYSLRATTNASTKLTTPTWSHLNGITKLFYVAPTGTDSLTGGWGLTWDKPFKSIAFAANYVNGGTLNPNAKLNLTNAKSWMITEMYYWMLYQKQQSISPFTPSSVFDATKTFRDSQFVIDSLIYDLARGGNSRTVNTALAYFSQEYANTIINASTEAQLPYFIAGLTQLLVLVANGLSGSAPAQSYQTLIGTTSFTGSISGTTLTVTSAPTKAGILIGQVISGGSIPAGTYIVANLSGTGTGSSSTWTVSNTVTQASITMTSVPVTQPTAVGSEFNALADVTTLFNLIITALSTKSTAALPSPNAGLTSTILVKTGTYSETLPIIIGENVAICGDELRGSVVQPATRIIITITAASDTNNTLITASTAMLADKMPIQLVTTFGGLTAGVTYYVIGSSITSTQFSVSATSGGSALSLTLVTSGAVTMYAGDCLKDMFRMRNGSGLRNFTLNGLLGILGPVNAYLTQRPTGGAFTSLDPGTGPTDTSAWIYKRSPYVQNVTNFGEGCTGLKIDGTLHNGGNKSIVCNDYTQILSNGIGIWVTGPSSVCEAVSVFSYYNYAGYFAEAGGRLRATNGNSSYGVYGVIAEGYDTTETPISGIVFNQSSQVQATVQSSFGSSAQLVRTSYSNAGAAYNTTTTNLLNYSNNFLGAPWSQTNILLSKNTVAPTGYVEAWAFTSSGTSTSINQSVTVPPAGTIYSALSGIGGSGSNATFDVRVTGTAYVVTTNFGGAGYIVGDQIIISGSLLGGVNITNDCTLTVFSLSGNAILTVTPAGTVPTGSAKRYTTSVYVKQGTASTVALGAVWAGNTLVNNGISFNFASGVITPYNDGIMPSPTQYGALALPNGWYRLWFASYDSTGLNYSLSASIFPVGLSPVVGQYNYFYGSQLENSSTSGSPSFYLEVAGTTRYTAYANYNIVGAGTGAIAVGDEIRSSAVFETRVTTDSIGVTGGAGYLTASNNAQGGNAQYAQLAQSDTNTAQNYIGMRLFINSGTASGQYGYIASYDASTKIAYILKESFDPLQVISSSAADNTMVLGVSYDTTTLYTGQPVQFIPTYYTTTVATIGISSVSVTAAIGGTTNTLTVTSTAQLQDNMAITFSGSLVFGNILAGFTYYISKVVNSTTIRITNSLYGADWQLTTASGNMTMNFPSYTNYLQAVTSNMVVNYPIQFTGTSVGGLVVGTTYYINDIVDGSNFTISGSLVTISPTASNSVTTNTYTVASTSTLSPLTPILFSGGAGAVFGGVAEGTKYYISKINSPTEFSIASSLLTVTVSATSGTGNNLITCSSTTGFVSNNPIQFVGLTFGGLNSEQTYYISAISVDGITFTVSNLPGQGAVNLTAGSGICYGKTCPSPFLLSTVGSGTMTGTSTASKTRLTYGYSTINGTFSTQLFSNVVLGTTYYINTIDSLTRKITVASSLANVGVTAFTLLTKTGSMNLAAVGWDHVNPGTPISPTINSSSVYFIEPRTTYQEPAFLQTTMAAPISLGSGTWSSIAYGDGYWIALPSSNATAAGSSDGSSWVSLALPSSASWTGIAYGNGYWIGIATGSSNIIRSVSNGQGWRTTSLGSSSTWISIAYGNGLFVAIPSDNTATVYSTNFGATWSAGALPGKTSFIASGTAQLSTAQKQFGATSLYLDGTANAYISTPSNADYGYGTGDFTVECWVYVSAIGVAQAIFDHRTSATEVSLLAEISAVGNFRLYVNGSYVITGNSTITANTWTHLAVSKAGGTTRLFVGGTVQGTTYTDSNNYAAKPVVIGAYYNGTARFTGYIDEFRVTKGLSRYSGTFTPAGPFTNDTNTVALLHFDGANASTVMSNAIPASTYSSMAYGSGRFVAIASGTTAAFSTDGISWTASVLPASTTWTSITYGNGLFVAVSSTTAITAYSVDGATWYGSNLTISANYVKYGQGIFLALASGSNVAYTSPDGASWKVKSVSSSNYSTLGFGFTASNAGLFIAFHGATAGSTIIAGTKTKGRANVVSGVITSVSEFEPGSGYNLGVASVTFTDPNVTTLAQVTSRVANGVLSSPTFVNRGSGYNTNSTAITISGNGYADAYQTGLSIILNNLSRLPLPGDNLQITGVSQNYKVTSATSIFGTVAPNIEANVQIAPAMTTANSPANGVTVSIRQKYSQARLTGHDFLNIGYGTQAQSNYPGVPTDTALQQQNQTIETNFGRVFFTSTDQDGNFKVGNLFGVQQATGIVTLSASQFGLTGLNTLSLGGIAVGGSSVIVNQFSTDSTFVANSDNIIPTQKAIRSYLTSRLSQGGANTFTGQLTAGTVLVGGPDKIGSTIPNGVAGSVVVMKNLVYFKAISGYNVVDGNMAALDFFMRRR